MGAQNADAPGLTGAAGTSQANEHAQSNTKLDALPPLRRARAELVLGLLRDRRALLVDAGRTARFLWGDRGLSLAQRDRAVEDLIEAGHARLDSSGPMVVVELAAGEVVP